jgi:tetratricopeptide (TPR) repeat protein
MKALLASLAALALSACTNGNNAPASTQENSNEIPVTTTSPQALEHFQKGRLLLENIRFNEAAEQFEQALKLDPGFASARALYGAVTPGADGLKEIQRASEQAGNLPRAERLYIETRLASAHNDIAQSVTLGKQLVEAAPSDARAHLTLGQILLFNADETAAAGAELQKAVDLDPKSGPALNMLGYVSLREGNTDKAIDAFRRYAVVNPQEPNPQDSLGEALLAAGRFGEAETAFRSAAELSPRFWSAWEGVAYSKFYAGDFAGGREALSKARQVAERPTDKVATEGMFGWAALAERKTDEALKAFDAAEKVADVNPSDIALVPVHRAIVLVEARRYPAALAQLDRALQLVASGTLPPFATRNVKRQAEKTVAALEGDAGARPDDHLLQSALHFAQGMAASAAGDRRAAQAHFAQCSAQDTYCQGAVTGPGRQAAVAQTSGANARATTPPLVLRDPIALALGSRQNQVRPQR